MNDFSAKIIRSPRRRTLAIQVEPDLSLSVLAPTDISERDIAAALTKRRTWIQKQQAYFRQFHPLPAPSRYRSGETHYHLGRQYRLRVIERMPSTMVGIVGEHLEVLLSGPTNASEVETALEGWYRSEAGRVLPPIIEECWRLVRKYGVPRPILRIRTMKGRWGSCTAAGTITVHPALVRVPSHCIRYVALHELCHMRHPNHGTGFVRMLSRLMPAWKSTKATLEKWSEIIPVS